jgi:hypothetical protein
MTARPRPGACKKPQRAPEKPEKGALIAHPPRRPKKTRRGVHPKPRSKFRRPAPPPEGQNATPPGFALGAETGRPRWVCRSKQRRRPRLPKASARDVGRPASGSEGPSRALRPLRANAAPNRGTRGPGTQKVTRAFLATRVPRQRVRTPLNGILGMADLFCSTHPAHVRADHLRQGREGSPARRLLSLIEEIPRLLQESKPTSSRSRARPVSSRWYAGGGRGRACWRRVPAKGLEIACRISTEPPARTRGSGDAPRLAPVLLKSRRQRDQGFFTRDTGPGPFRGGGKTRPQTPGEEGPKQTEIVVFEDAADPPGRIRHPRPDPAKERPVVSPGSSSKARPAGPPRRAQIPRPGTGHPPPPLGLAKIAPGGIVRTAHGRAGMKLASTTPPPGPRAPWFRVTLAASKNPARKRKKRGPFCQRPSGGARVLIARRTSRKAGLLRAALRAGARLWWRALVAHARWQASPGSRSDSTMRSAVRAATDRCAPSRTPLAHTNVLVTPRERTTGRVKSAG